MSDMSDLVLESLRKEVESKHDNDWGVVYLDNARPKGMNDKQFRACLSALSRRNLYRVIDGYAFGMVRLSTVA